MQEAHGEIAKSIQKNLEPWISSESGLFLSDVCVFFGGLLFFFKNLDTWSLLLISFVSCQCLLRFYKGFFCVF